MTEQSSGQGYPSSQGFNDSTSDFTMWSFMIQQALASVRTCVPVKILAVTNAGELSPVGFVDAQPLVKQMNGAAQTMSHGTLFHLPYFRVQGGTNAFIMDPVVGDVGFAVICDRDISSVKANKGEANPGSRRVFSLPDGIYIGGILNGTPTQYVQFTGGNINVTATTEVIVTAPNIQLAGNVEVTGNLAIDGKMTGVDGAGAIHLDVPIISSKEITANGIDLSVHHHTGVTTGGGNTGGPAG